MPKALRIVGWFDDDRGYEPVCKTQGKPDRYKGPLDWYIYRIHTGNKRRKLIAKFGAERALSILGLFSLMCEHASRQPLARRPWILDRFGEPVGDALIAAELGIPSKWFRSQIAILIRLGWLSRDEYKVGLGDTQGATQGATQGDTQGATLIGIGNQNRSNPPTPLEKGGERLTRAEKKRADYERRLAESAARQEAIIAAEEAAEAAKAKRA